MKSSMVRAASRTDVTNGGSLGGRSALEEGRRARHTGPMTRETGVRKEALRAELVWARGELTGMLRSLSDEDLRRPSPNPAWTNDEAICHIALGFLILPGVAAMIRFWSALPPGSSTPFVAALDAATPLFNRINALGPRVVARIYPGQALGRRLDRAHSRALRMLDSLDERDLDRGMRFPASWDPVYGDRITIEELFRLPAAHLRSHLPVVRLS